MKNKSDYEIISQYLAGDEKSFEILVSRYMERVYRFVRKYVADDHSAQDLTQEVFLKVWRHTKKIDKNKNFKSWIYTVAKNTALDFIKKKKSIPFSNFEIENGKNILIDQLADSLHLPDAIAESKEKRNAFMGAIGKLSERYKLTLSLYYYQYLNFREIAEVLQEPINTIKSRHRRGLMLLKKYIVES